MIDYYEPNIELSFLGCGYLVFYYIGAIHLLAQVWPQKSFKRISGASSGGLIGALFIVGFNIENILRITLNILDSMRNSYLYPWQRKCVSLNMLVRQYCHQYLPLSAHKLCSGRLGLSLTELSSYKNRHISQFHSRQDLIDALVAGCYIPFYSGSISQMPNYKNKHFIDGGFTNNMPKFPPSKQHKEDTSSPNGQQQTIQLSLTPFAAKIDVSPPDKRGPVFKLLGIWYYFNVANMIRFLRAMLPFRVQVYKVYLLAGHRDMKNHLLKLNLIKCRDCYLSRRSTTSHLYGGCIFCLRLLETVDSLEVKEDNLSLFE